MKRIFLITLILLSLTGCNKEPKKEDSKTVKNNGMLSYTIDGEKTDIKPTKEDGYIVNKIICDNGSDMMWDNDNWEVELTKVNGKDSCKVDFTKDTSKEGYRVTVTTNLNSALDSLSKATTENGTIIIYSKSKIKSVTECNGVIENNKVMISNINYNQTCNINVYQTLAYTIKKAYQPQTGRTDFSVIDDGNPALYTETDDQGTTYYFSGDGSMMNNWVKFADKWWRIIRINGNGSVRLLYAGDGNNAIDIGKSQFVSLYSHPSYVGWKYTQGNSLSINRQNETKSTIYKMVETWYEGLVSTDKSYIDTEAIYCNDRNLASGNRYSESTKFDYAGRERVYTNKIPTFICSNISDRFNTFGLITADEVMYGGGCGNCSNPKAYYYLAKDGSSSITGNEVWWTMTPYYWSDTSAGVMHVSGSKYPGYLSHGWVSSVVNDSYVVRPVISLKPEVLVTGGDGSASTPYEVTLE